jgi:hypothetical protein
VEGQIRRLKAGTEWATIDELDIGRDETLSGRSWGDLTEGQKLDQLRLGTDVVLLPPQERHELLAREVDFARVGPTREQIEATMGRIKEVTGVTYMEGIEYDAGDQHPRRSGLEPIPFHALTSGDRVEILASGVDWEGFTDAQRGTVIRRVIEGHGAESWMEGLAPAEPGDAEIRVLPGKDNLLTWRDDRSFVIHDATGKIGYLTGYLGGPWSDVDADTEFRITHVEITAPGRKLSPGEWKDVLHGLRQHLPDAEYLGGNRTGINGDLSPAYEKLVRLPDAEPAARRLVPSPGQLGEAMRQARTVLAESEPLRSAATAPAGSDGAYTLYYLDGNQRRFYDHTDGWQYYLDASGKLMATTIDHSEHHAADDWDRVPLSAAERQTILLALGTPAVELSEDRGAVDTSPSLKDRSSSPGELAYGREAPDAMRAGHGPSRHRGR